MNKQREVVYHRRELLSPEPLKEDVIDMCEAVIEEIVAAHCDPEVEPENWDWAEIDNGFSSSSVSARTSRKRST